MGRAAVTRRFSTATTTTTSSPATSTIRTTGTATTTATRTDPVGDDELLELLAPLVDLLLIWSYEGTERCEAVVGNVAARYGRTVEAAFMADAAVLTVGERTLAFAREPTVPPLNQVSELKHLLTRIDGGALSPRAAGEQLSAVCALPARWSRPWQVVGLTLFSVGFGISVEATWQEVGCPR